VNVVKRLNFVPLKLPKLNTTLVEHDDSGKPSIDAEFEIMPPQNTNANDFVQIRIMSADFRDGMVNRNYFFSSILSYKNEPFYVS
jgi:hypothetical protein